MTPTGTSYCIGWEARMTVLKIYWALFWDWLVRKIVPDAIGIAKNEDPKG